LPTVRRETRARPRAVRPTPKRVHPRRATANKGKRRINNVGLYRHKPKARPLKIGRPASSREKANARQKKAKADNCPPSQHSIRNGSNVRANRKATARSPRGMEGMRRQVTAKPAPYRPADITSQIA